MTLTLAANDPNLKKIVDTTGVQNVKISSVDIVSAKSKTPLAAHLAVIARCKEHDLESRVERFSEMIICRVYDKGYFNIGQLKKSFDTFIYICIELACWLYGIDFKKSSDVRENWMMQVICMVSLYPYWRSG